MGSGRILKFAPHLSSVDAGDTGQKVTGKENAIEQGSSHGQDAARIAILAGSGAALGALVDRGVKGAGIGAGAGAAVGLATALLTHVKKVDLRQGQTLDAVFNRPLPYD